MINGIHNPELLSKLNELFAKHPSASRFVQAYSQYCHAIDDYIDEPATYRTPERFLGILAQSATIFSSAFYQEHRERLWPVVQLVTSEYADSVAWERETDNWRARHADAMRNCGNNMLFAVILIIGGYEKLRELSIMCRETSYADHHNEVGEPT